MDKMKKESPCKYCINSKYDVVQDKCYELSCIGYSCFQPAENTPNEIFEEVEDTHENHLW